MDELPLVSIVVVSYNQGKYIRENLDSIKSQTYQNIELIIADDASPDDSVKVFQEWIQENDYPAKTNFHQSNTGLATVLNECLDLCKGKYVKFIAADDYLRPDYLEKTVRCLEEKGPEYGMVFTNTFRVDEHSHIQPDFCDYNALGGVSPVKFREDLIKGNRIAALTVLMRTDALKATGLYDAEFLVEDYYRWLRINEKYYIAYVPEKLAYYRMHVQNISKTKRNLIGTETIMLQMKFDHGGIVQESVNHFLTDLYVGNGEISPKLFSYFKKYPFACKGLKFCIQYRIPTVFYTACRSLVLRFNLKFLC